MPNKVFITRMDRRVRALSDVERGLLKRCALAALEAEGIDLGEAQILYTGDRGIQRINLEQRSLDKPTDVLSFPAFSPGQERVFDPESGRVFLGDVVLSLETAERQAEAFGHPVGREMGYLTVHGVLHLLGYDHMTGEEKLIMRTREEEVLLKLGISR